MVVGGCSGERRMTILVRLDPGEMEIWLYIVPPVEADSAGEETGEFRVNQSCILIDQLGT